MEKENVDLKNPGKGGIERPGQLTPDTAAEKIGTRIHKTDDKTENAKKDNSIGNQDT